MSDAGGEVVFRLAIPADTWLAYYRGAARDVVARAEDGRTVRFPARLLRPFVGHDGVHGAFRLRYDAAGHCVDLSRL